jgi:hypothetical protein
MNPMSGLQIIMQAYYDLLALTPLTSEVEWIECYTKEELEDNLDCVPSNCLDEIAYHQVLGGLV